MDTADRTTWRKSSYSGGGSSECLEAGVADRRRVLVRDSKNRDGVTLQFSRKAWAVFTGALK
jgi:hypothetical protein